jgi:hypothetical protein
MKVYELDSTGAVEGLILWPAVEVKAIYGKMRRARSRKQLYALIQELGNLLAYSGCTKYYPDEDLADIFTGYSLARRVEIIQAEKKHQRRGIRNYDGKPGMYLCRLHP